MLPRSKYGNQKVEEDNYVFDSKAEHRRYRELKLLHDAQKVTAIIVHPRFPIDMEGERICIYVADFQYFDRDHHVWVVEDVKGAKTAAYRLKKKLFRAAYGFDITEVEA